MYFEGKFKRFVIIGFFFIAGIFGWSIYQEINGCQVFSDVDFNKGEKETVLANESKTLSFSKKTDSLVSLHIPFIFNDEISPSDFYVNINNNKEIIYGKKIDSAAKNSAILVLDFPQSIKIKSLEIVCSKNITYLNHGKHIQTKQYGLQKKYRILFPICYSILCLLAVIFFYATNKYIKNFAFKYFIYAIISGCVCILVWPALNVPDEKVHFNTANFYANVMTGMQSIDEKKTFTDVIIRKCDTQLYPNEITSNPKFLRGAIKDVWKDVKDYKKYYAYAFPKLLKTSSSSEYITSNVQIIEDASRTIYFIPHIIGIMISRKLNVNQFVLYYFSCFLSLLFTVSIITFAFLKTKCKSILFYFLALNPALLQAMCHFTYDGTIYSCALSFILFIFTYYKKRKISDLILSVIFLILLYPAKNHIYLILGGLYLILGGQTLRKFYKNKKLFYFCLIFIVVVLALLCINFVVHNPTVYASYMETKGNVRLVHTPTYVLLHPFDFTMRLFYTILTQFTKIFGQSLGLVTGLRLFISSFIVQILFFIIFYFSIIDSSNFTLSKNKKSLCLIISSLVFLFVCTGMFIGYGDNMYIQGVQGRYFIPILPLVFMSLPEKLKLNKIHNNSAILQLVIPLYVLILHIDIFALILR